MRVLLRTFGHFAFIGGAALLLASCGTESSPPHAAAPAGDTEIAIWKAIARLAPREGQIGSGFAEASYFEGGKISLMVRTSLPPFPNGRYVAIVREEQGNGSFTIGDLKQRGDDGTYVLATEGTWEGITPQSSYRRVVISWEQDGEAAEPILEGTLDIVQSPR